MKFVLAFMLLIGIFCQIGRGDDSLADGNSINGFSSMLYRGFDYLQKSIYSYVPDFSTIPESAKKEYQNIKDSMGNMVEGARSMVGNTMSSVKDAESNVESLT